MLNMTDKPTPPPREPLRLPPNGRDVTAEKIGTVIGITGATAAEQPRTAHQRLRNAVLGAVGGVGNVHGTGISGRSAPSGHGGGVRPTGSGLLSSTGMMANSIWRHCRRP
jgi:hypothetical protein